MDEAPVRVMVQIGQVIDEAVEEHERRCHAIPPPDDSPVTEIPYADYKLTDDEMSHVLEMLDDSDEGSVAARIGIPVLALCRILADYERRYGKFIYMRRTGSR